MKAIKFLSIFILIVIICLPATSMGHRRRGPHKHKKLHKHKRHCNGTPLVKHRRHGSGTPIMKHKRHAHRRNRLRRYGRRGAGIPFKNHGTPFKNHLRHKKYSALPKMTTCKVKLFDRHNRLVSHLPYIGRSNNYKIACNRALLKCRRSTNLYRSKCRIQ